jgi:hypothetical protein
MKTIKGVLFILLTLFIFTNCAKKDPIDHVVTEASKNIFFGNGPFIPINLPPNAPIADVVIQVFKNAIPLPIPTGTMNVVTQREVNISDQEYITVLVKSVYSQKVVLLRYEKRRLVERRD